jgi:hypothetical protein
MSFIFQCFSNALNNSMLWNDLYVWWSWEVSLLSLSRSLSLKPVSPPNWSLNSGLFSCKADALSLGSHLQSVLVILEMGSHKLFSWASLEPQNARSLPQVARITGVSDQYPGGKFLNITVLDHKWELASVFVAVCLFCTFAVWTQKLSLARQIFYHLSHASSLFCFRILFR